jgi:hypothetical protein
MVFNHNESYLIEFSIRYLANKHPLTTSSHSFHDQEVGIPPIRLKFNPKIFGILADAIESVRSHQPIKQWQWRLFFIPDLDRIHQTHLCPGK